MPNFNQATKKEEIVIANIDRIIGGLQARQELAECEVEKQTSKVAIRLLETTRCEIVMATEQLINSQRNISKVINRARGQFKFREEISTCEVEEDIYKDVKICLDIILEGYLEAKKEFPKLWGACGVIRV